MAGYTGKAFADYFAPAAMANRGLDLACALYPTEPDRAAEIVKETMEQYADTVLNAKGDPYGAIVKRAKERDEDRLRAGYKALTNLGDGWSTLWPEEDEEEAWRWHLISARK